MIRQILLGWGFLFARPEKFTALIARWLEEADPNRSINQTGSYHGLQERLDMFLESVDPANVAFDDDTEEP